MARPAFGYGCSPCIGRWWQVAAGAVMIIMEITMMDGQFSARNGVLLLLTLGIGSMGLPP